MAERDMSETPALWLKAQTRTEHVATEQTALAQKMAHGELSLSHFVCLVASYEGLHADVERTAVASGLGELIRQPTKSMWARSDLDALLVEASDLPEALRQAFAELPPSRPAVSRAFALGRLYVMEGSALGAVMLGPLIERTLGLTTGMRYFRGAGAETMPRWMAFRGVVDRELADAQARDEARLGAIAQFNLVRHIFEVVDGCAHETVLKRLVATG